MKVLGLAAVLLALGIIATPANAQANPQCNPRDDVLELLAKKYKEAPVAVGITNTGGLIEVLAEPNGNTWTIIVTTPKGISCLVAAGEGWREMKQVATGPEA